MIKKIIFSFSLMIFIPVNSIEVTTDTVHYTNYVKGTLCPIEAKVELTVFSYYLSAQAGEWTGRYLCRKCLEAGYSIDSLDHAVKVAAVVVFSAAVGYGVYSYLKSRSKNNVQLTPVIA
jgi:hypothetical protein